MLRSVNSSRVRKLRYAFADKDWEKKDVFSVIGESTVRQAVNAGIAAELLYVSDCPIPFEKKTQVTPEVMEYITLGRKTSLVAICRKTEIPIPAGELHRILVLDRVEFRGNIGRMMYLAFCFGVDLVYYSEGDGTNYHARSIANASQGASFFLPARPANLPEKLRELKAQGWYIVGTSLRDAVPLSGISAHDKMVFVVGNEQVGVSEEVLQATDVNCRIEMENYDSLNVAIAAGILLHRFRIQEGRFSKTKRRF